jgi:DNA-binding NarL/FixJ family response regulator
MDTEHVAPIGAHDHQAVAILLVDEHLIFREGLRKLLEGEPGFKVVGGASGPDEAVLAIEAHKPDVAIVGLTGRPLVRLMQMLQDARLGHHQVRTIVLTTTIERMHIVQALRLGVSGMLLNDTSPEVMFDSVRGVAAGHCWIGGEQLTDMAQALLRPASSKARFWLTPRELEIVEGVRRGDTNKAIARQLSITENTVKHHLTNIFSKVGVYTRLQLAVFAINHDVAVDRGIVDDTATIAAAV